MSAKLSDLNKILNKLGYVGRDPLKVQEVGDYIIEAEEFMRGAGVPHEQITSKTAFSVKSIWADRRDKGQEETLIKADSFVVNLIAQMRLRRSNG